MFPLISPLEARKDGSYFVVIVIGLLIIAVAIGIGILLAILSKKKAAKFNNPDRKTTKADIETVAKKMELNEIETGFLAYICKKHNVPNLLLTIKDNDKLMQIFKDEVSGNEFSLEDGVDKKIEKIIMKNKRLKLLVTIKLICLKES